MEIQPIGYLAARWRVVGAACLVAAVISGGATLLMPKKYTAATRLFIEPPAGSDQRVAVAVTPIYLDSLRTYEMFASSDTMFYQAVERFGLRRGARSIDRLKKSILKVEVPRNTKILEISCTLEDAKRAHDVALYIAQETVKLNAGLGTDSEKEVTEDGEKQVAATKARLDRAQRAWNASPDQSLTETLRAEVASDEELRHGLQKQATEQELAGAANAKIRERIAALDQQIAKKRNALAESTARLETLDNELIAARQSSRQAEAKAMDMRTYAGYHGEKLRIIDPGIVPERPSSPDLMLNLVIAVVAGAVLSAGFLLLAATTSLGVYSRDERPVRMAIGRD